MPKTELDQLIEKALSNFNASPFVAFSVDTKIPFLSDRVASFNGTLAQAEYKVTKRWVWYPPRGSEVFYLNMKVNPPTKPGRHYWQEVLIKEFLLARRSEGINTFLELRKTVGAIRESLNVMDRIPVIGT